MSRIDEFRRYIYNGFDPKVNKKDIPTVQLFIEADRDGIWGPKSQAALDAYRKAYEEEMENKNAPSVQDKPKNVKSVESPYLTSLLSSMDNDEYNWNTISQPGYRAGFGVEQQVSDGLTGANGFNGMSSAKAERIAQIKKRLAEIAEEKKKYNVEEEIGKYKFLYDNDPSVLMNYKQNMRNNEINKEIRKSSEDATKASNLQAAWKQNAIDLEVARYDLAAAKNAYNEAKGASNTDAMNRAAIDIERAQAKYNRIAKENETLRGQMMTALGIDLGDENELQTVDNKPAGTSFAKDIADAEAIKKLDGNLDRLDKAIVVDNVNVDKKTKAANVKNWLADIEQAKKDVEASSLSTEQKEARKTKLSEMEAKVRSYAKPSPKGGQGTKMTREDYQNELDKLATKSQLVAKGYKWLKAAKDLGATHTWLDAAIGVAAGK